jgi:hypothetical protein
MFHFESGSPTTVAPRAPQWRLQASLKLSFFGLAGIVIMIVSGGIAIYVSHFHLWD